MKGWISKYILQKTNGSPIDPNGIYFVLKLNSEDVAHAVTSRGAARRYA